MKVNEIKSDQDVVNFIEGCLEDFQTFESSKNETVSNIVDLIVHLVKKARETKNH